MNTKVNTSEEQARANALHAKSNARLTMLFTRLTLLVGIFVVAAVAYDIYIPRRPPPAGTTTIKIGAPTKPTSVLRPPLEPNPAARKAKVQVEGETRDKGQTEAAGGNFVLMWKAPRVPKP